MTHSFKKGDHLKTSRTGYSHHGLYLGNNKVIHYKGLEKDIFSTDTLKNGISKGEIQITDIEDFTLGNKVQAVKHQKTKYNIDERIERAKSKLGEDNYNFFSNNCEHFVHWCIDGEKKSIQVRSWVSGMTSVVAVAVAAVTAIVINKRK